MAILAALVALCTRHRPAEQLQRPQSELSRYWCLLRTDEEVRDATLRALCFEQDQAREIADRVARRHQALERAQARCNMAPERIHVVVAPTQQAPDHEAA